MDSTPSGFAPGNQGITPVTAERDIYFVCGYCRGELVVDREGAGLNVPCSHCGKEITIPFANAEIEPVFPVPAAVQFNFADKSREELERRFNDLKHQLKENQSQDTEMRGHVNRATMELHRLQLKLKKLGERHIDIAGEIGALADWLDNGVD